MRHVRNGRERLEQKVRLESCVCVCVCVCVGTLYIFFGKEGSGDPTSPRNPKVAIDLRSSNLRSFDVVNRSHTIGNSEDRIPCPLSVICSSLIPPLPAVIVMLQ